jgi:hypothetical protein
MAALPLAAYVLGGSLLALVAAVGLARIFTDTEQGGGDECPDSDSYPATLLNASSHESGNRI